TKVPRPGGDGRPRYSRTRVVGEGRGGSGRVGGGSESRRRRRRERRGERPAVGRGVLAYPAWAGGEVDAARVLVGGLNAGGKEGRSDHPCARDPHGDLLGGAAPVRDDPSGAVQGDPEAPGSDI